MPVRLLHGIDSRMVTLLVVGEGGQDELAAEAIGHADLEGGARLDRATQVVQHPALHGRNLGEAVDGVKLTIATPLRLAGVEGEQTRHKWSRKTRERLIELSLRKPLGRRQPKSGKKLGAQLAHGRLHWHVQWFLAVDSWSQDQDNDTGDRMRRLNKVGGFDACER